MSQAVFARVRLLLAALALLLCPAIASAQEQHRAFRVPFHTANGMILLDGEINRKPAPKQSTLLPLLAVGETPEKLLNLIHVAPAQEAMFRAFDVAHPELADKIERVLNYRASVAREFQRLTITGHDSITLVREGGQKTTPFWAGPGSLNQPRWSKHLQAGNT